MPIVASTGGLVDTVKEGFTGFQMGSFNVEVILIFHPMILDNSEVYFAPTYN